MQRRRLWWSIALLFLVASGVLAIISTTHVLAHVAHNPVDLASPTPTPDANTTLQQEETQIQSILSIIQVILGYIGILVVVFPLLITGAAVGLGVFGFRGFRALEQQGRDLLEDIKKLQVEAAEKKATIERTQEALVFLALGDRLSNQNDTRKAMEAYKKAGDLLPNDPQINYVLGRIYSGFGYYEEAITSFEATLAVKPQYPEAEMELGLAYRRRGEYRRGSDADALRNQDYQKAVEHLQRALALRPNYDDALSTLGGLYRRTGAYEKALEFYERAQRADLSSSYALGNAASLSWYLGKLDKARRYYMLTELASTDRTLTTHAEVYWDYYDLALAQLALGKTEDAKKSYAKAIGETPGVVQFDSVLDVLNFLHKAKDPIPGLDEVIQMITKEKATRVS